MKPAIKRKWVKALRSGKYRQGRNALRPTEKTFCCISVLADVGGCQWTGDSIDGFFVGRDSGSVLSQYYMRRFGLNHRTQSTLVTMNDGDENSAKRKPFKYIADWIEKNL